MIKKTSLLILFFLCVQHATAQTQITGRIIDSETKSPVAFATVAVYSVADTALVGGAITTDDGRFSINEIPKGHYVLRVSFIGYMTMLKDIPVGADNYPPLQDVGDIMLTKGVMLSEFEIKEMLIPIQVRGDTIEYAAEAFRPVEGSMLIDLLKLLPGAEVDKDGKVTLNGKEIKQILVEGEVFFTDDPQVALKNLPADFVQKIQAYEKKSDEALFTGIDDGEEQAVINIVLKPEIKMGWFGRVRLGGGLDENQNFRYANSANVNSFSGGNQLTVLLNANNSGRGGGDDDWIETDNDDYFRTGGGWHGASNLISPMVNFVKKFDSKLSIKGSYRYEFEDYKYGEHIRQEEILPDGNSQFFRRDRWINYTNHRHNFSTEVKYTPNERNEFIVHPRITLGRRFLDSRTNFDLSDDTLALINRGTTESSDETSSSMARLRLSYGHKFAKEKRTIRFNFDGTLRNSENIEYDSTVRHFAVLPTDTLNQRVKSIGNSNNLNLGITYTEPLIRDFSLSLSYNITNAETKNERTQNRFNPNSGKFDVFDSVFSNNFGDYSFFQNVLLQIQKQVEKYNYSIGLAVIPSNRLSYVEGRPDVPQNDFNLAPQARFRYNFSKQTNLNLNYRGSTRQPQANQLQNVPTNSNPSFVALGNPRLKSELNHQISGNFSRFSEKNHSNLYASIWTNLTQNRIADVTIFNPDLFPNIPLDSAVFRPGGRITSFKNVNFVYYSQGHVSYSMPFFEKKLNVSISAGGSINNSKSVIDNKINEMNQVSLWPGSSVMWKMERWHIRLRGYLGTTNTQYSLQSERNHVSGYRAAGSDFSYQIIKDKLTFSSDIEYETRSGLYAGFNPSSTVWNAQLAWNIGKKSDAQVLFRVIDILNDRRDTWRWASANFIRDISYSNTLKRMFMVSFIYNKRQTPTE